jgi:hypothetical protein
VLITRQVRSWITNRVRSCYLRAGGDVPREEWRRAVTAAVERSDGLCPYTGVPLDFDLPYTDAFYPSLDHVDGPDSFELVVTTRLVNDMKNIMSEAEFLRLVEHIYRYRVAGDVRPPVESKRIKPARDFARRARKPKG